MNTSGSIIGLGTITVFLVILILFIFLVLFIIKRIKK